MKYNVILKKELIRFSKQYGKSNFGDNYAHPNENRSSSIIFNKVSYSFERNSWESIQLKTSYFTRTLKKHPKSVTKNVFEMQSSNSSDALAMNIFCHPEFKKWIGIKNLFQLNSIENIEFGFKAKVLKNINNQNVEDDTEIDVLLNDSIFIECKLTEENFCSKTKKIVEQYVGFEQVFHIDKLCQTENEYENYQLIRNILAANQYKGKFILICDMRRPDLTRHFYQTLRCIKDDYLELRTNCEIIYWQDLAQVVGVKLKEFLNEKYGL